MIGSRLILALVAVFIIPIGTFIAAVGQHPVWIGGVLTSKIFIQEAFSFLLYSVIIWAILDWIAKKHEARKSERDKAAFEKKQLESERRSEQKFAREQAWKRAAGHISAATQLASELPRLASSANKALNLAEEEFREGVFTPFWDAVERAVKDLATFNSHTRSIIEHSRSYHLETQGLKKLLEAQDLKKVPGEFKIGTDTLPDVSNLTRRMQHIVRSAQKDFRFESIYQQRKTNQVLISGFNSLGEAIGNVGNQINSSLNELSCKLAIGMSEIESSQRESAETVADELRQMKDQVEEEIKVRQSRRDRY